jgi:hypothetical protein
LPVHQHLLYHYCCCAHGHAMLFLGRVVAATMLISMPCCSKLLLL